MTFFRPSKQGAQLEGSKAFAKQFMMRHHIPTAAYREFDHSNFDEGLLYLSEHPLPVVLKADGLAAGKGVVIAYSTAEAQETFTEMIQDQKFGSAGSRVVIEEFLTGIECSVFVLTDGKSGFLLPVAKDYKRIGEGDTGLNTGGMGAISPVPFADATFMKKVQERIIEPTIRGIHQEGIVYKGFVFIGLISVEGNPYVIEYNCRMGDPETEVVLLRLENDLVDVCTRLFSDTLHEVEPAHLSSAAATVMLVSKGYPEAYEKGYPIQRIDTPEGTIVFHAGTKKEKGEIYTNGGRVLAVTAMGDTIQDALTQCYSSAASVQFEGKYYRKDIGWEFPNH
jgi:phosphoribosylamine--glycine ligase